MDIINILGGNYWVNLCTIVALLVWVVVRRQLGFLIHASVKGKRMPPGSMGWPLVGQTLEFVKTNPAQELDPFIKKGVSKYGKLFQANLFWKRTIVSTDTEVNKFVMQGEGRLFRSNWPGTVIRMFGEHSILVVTGEEHRRTRALLVSFLGTGRSKMASVLPHVEAAALETLSSLRPNSTHLFLPAAKHFSFSVLCKIMVSLSERDIEQVHELFGAYDDGLFALPFNFPGTCYNKGLQARAKLVQLFQNIVKKRRQNPQESSNDMLDFVLSKGEGLSDEAIQDFLITVLFAGHDTSSKALTSIIKLISESPEALKELLREHDEIRGSKQKGEGLQMEDYLKMSFTQNVINEALRLVNVSLGLFKVALQDVEVKDHLIPKGCNVFVSQSSAHFDPDTFANPNRFDPFRWQKSTKASSVSSFMPFGGGVRLCPGAELARLDMAVFLHYFLTGYSWEILEPADAQIVHSPMLTISNGLPIRITPRN